MMWFSKYKQIDEATSDIMHMKHILMKQQLDHRQIVKDIALIKRVLSSLCDFHEVSFENSIERNRLQDQGFTWIQPQEEAYADVFVRRKDDPGLKKK